jgi:hypothetical protein
VSPTPLDAADKQTAIDDLPKASPAPAHARKAELCEDYHRTHATFTSWLGKPDTRFTGTCRSLHFAS